MIIRDRRAIAQIKLLTGTSKKDVLKFEIRVIEREREEKKSLTFETKGSK